MQLKPAFMILRGEVISIECGKPPEPWCWPKAAEFFGFDGDDDPRFPVNGVSRIDRSNSDIDAVLRKDSDWDSFQCFMKEFVRIVRDKLDPYLITVGSDKNPYKEGAAIYSKYFRRVTDRKRNNRYIDLLLQELEIAPYQQAAQYSQLEWPMTRDEVSYIWLGYEGT